MEKKSIPVKALPTNTSKPFPDTNSNPEEDLRIFQNAMSDIKPIRWKNYFAPRNNDQGSTPANETDKNDTYKKLHQLIKYGEGFIVSSTPEYMEGTGIHVNPVILRRLHKGDFSIQAHIDLHGLNTKDARKVFDQFLKDSILKNNRSLLIVHGRGLSSKQGPVLKNQVYTWLTSGPWRKWIIAFSSARSCDGGAGATYVLLRKQPYTKRLMKKCNSHKK